MKRETAPVLTVGRFECSHLTEADMAAVAGFAVDREEAKGLERYLKEWALDEEKESCARTYLIRDTYTNELAFYFSLKAGLMTINDVSCSGANRFDSLPGIELSNIAKNSVYTNNHPDSHGLGAFFFEKFVLPIVMAAKEVVGVKILYIFSLPYEDLMSHYKSMGFSRLNSRDEEMLHSRIKPNYDQNCIFMYQLL